MVDLDFHHGNGSQQIFWDDPDVLTISIHGDPDRQYPYYTGRRDERGGGSAEGANINYPLPRGVDGEAYLRVVRDAAERLDGYSPQFLVVPLGTDTYRLDPMGDFALATADYRLIGSLIGSLGLPTLAVLEGGYAVDDIGANVAAFIAGLAEGGLGG